ncbi:MAG: MFS transporter [Alphaproteobacteria bacterium]
MDPRIMTLALASFAVGTGSYAFTGLLSDVAADLDVSVGTAGQLASSFALTFAVTAPFLASLTSGLDRKRILVAALIVLGLLNIAAAFSPDFSSLLWIRIACGLASTLISPVAGAAAASLVPPEQRGKALAVVLAGLTLALAFGIPMGTAIGGIFDWRATFTYGGLVCLVSAGVLLAVLPPVPSTDRPGFGALKVAFQPAVFTNLLFTGLGFTATFSTVAYIGPVITSVTGLSGSSISGIQLFVGIGAIFGVILGGILTNRGASCRQIMALFAVQAVILSLFTLDMEVAPLGPPLGQPGSIALMAMTVMVSAMVLFALGPVIQIRLISSAPEAAAVVLALNGSMIFFGQGLGAGIGGVVIDAAGLTTIGLAGAAFALLGAATAAVAAFRNGEIGGVSQETPP